MAIKGLTIQRKDRYMPYIEEKCVAGNTIEINKYYSFAAHKKGEKRSQRINDTPERIRKSNQRIAYKNLRRLMNANFKDGDYLLTLDFNEKPPDSISMQDTVVKGIRKIRDKCKKQSIDFRYIYVKEVGPKGSRHIHMVCNEIPVSILKESWSFGRIHIDILNTNGQYRKIAKYFIKYALKTEETEGMLIGKRWYASRNLTKPIVRKKRISSQAFRKTPKTVEGYYLEKDSERSGISDITGYEYYSYSLIKQEGG